MHHLPSQRIGCLKVFYIALDIELEKIEKMERWLAETDLDYVRVPGKQFDPEINDNFYDQKKRLSRYGFELTVGELGCFLAHRDCWKRIVDSRSMGVILESDVEPLYVGRFTSLMQSLETYSDCFDLLRLHGVFERNEICIR